MKRFEAIDIIKKLLDGVNPVTGQVLGRNHVCCEPEVMRALHSAVMAMEAGAAREDAPSDIDARWYRRNGSLNAGRPWTEKDSRQLAELFRQGMDIDEICVLLQRRRRGVEHQLDMLGLKRSAEEETPEKPENDRPCNAGKPWSRVDSEWLIMAWHNGTTVEELAETLGRTPLAIRCRLEKAGLEHGGEPPQWTEKDTRELLWMVGKNYTTEEMAKHFGRTVKAIEARLFYLGLSNKAPKLFDFDK